jgi:hypothetical protein
LSFGEYVLALRFPELAERDGGVVLVGVGNKPSAGNGEELFEDNSGTAKM